ncbi:hypothetical protein T484DRAFT_1844778, partial [Baffinella frigidus]
MAGVSRSKWCLRCAEPSDICMSAIQFSLIVGFTYLVILAVCCVALHYRKKYLIAAMGQNVRVEGAREPRPPPPNGTQPTTLFEDSVVWASRGLARAGRDVVWLASKIDASIDRLLGVPRVNVDESLPTRSPPQPSTNAPARSPFWVLGEDGQFHAQRAPASAPVRERQLADVDLRDLEDGEVAGFIEGLSPSSGQAMPWASLPTAAHQRSLDVIDVAAIDAAVERRRQQIHPRPPAAGAYVEASYAPAGGFRHAAYDCERAAEGRRD